jgi:cellulose synthase operon protein C
MPSKLRTLFTHLVAVVAVVSMATVAACSSAEDRAQSHYQRGAEYLEAGDHTRAMLEFRNAIRLDETLPGAWFGMARIHEQEQNWPAVLRSLQSVIELDATHVEARTRLARLRLADGDVDRALALVNAANELKPDDSEIHALRGAVLLRLNDREGARADAERAVYLDRDNPDAYAVLAADALLDGNSTAAMRNIDRGLQAEPLNSGLLLFKLKIHEDNEDVQGVETVMRQLIVARPEHKDIRRALVRFLLGQGRRDDAETEMRALVAADPADSTAALELVQFVASVKGAEAARQELTRLIEANPDVVDYQLAMARFDFAQARPEAAVERLQEIITRDEASEDAQRARLLLAGMKLQDNDSEAAATLVEEVLAADEKNADALALRATLRLQAGDYERATLDLREALNQQPQSVPLLQLMARVFERQGVIDLANDHYVQALRASNYAPAVALQYANFLTSRGDSVRAEAILSETSARAPNNADVLAALAQVRLRQQDWAGAQDVAELLKARGDRSGISNEILGSALLGQERFDQSIETLKSAYSETPQAVRPMYALVTAYVRSGQTDEAEAFLNSVLTANPDSAEAHVLLGSLHAMKNEPDEAVAAYETAIERQPQNPVGYQALARHLLASGQFNDAEAILIRGREQAPDDYGLNLTMAGILEQRSDPEGALAIYEELLERQPDSLILVNNVASLIADHRTDGADLERAYQLALRLRDVDVPHFKDTLGWILYRRGDYQAALGHLEAAVQGLPEHPLVRYHLAMTYAALERHEDAKAEFGKAAELVGEGDPLGDRIQEALSSLTKPQSVN